MAERAVAEARKKVKRYRQIIERLARETTGTVLARQSLAHWQATLKKRRQRLEKLRRG